MMSVIADKYGVPILVGDIIRVIATGGALRPIDVGRHARVAGFTPTGRVRLDHTNRVDPIAGGRALPARMVAVTRRDGKVGLEGHPQRKQAEQTDAR